jgi:type IV fimbrial biogenesis protein FimT
MKQQGFTLIELIIVCAIISIIAFSGSSSYAFLQTNSRIDVDKTRLLLIIRMARQQSVNSYSTVALCPSNDTKICIRDWKLPIILFSDRNKNKKRDDDEPIIQQFSPFDNKDVTINYPKSQIRFNSQGMANYYNGTLAYCFQDHISGIVISRIGRIRFAQDLDGDHIPDVNLRTPVTCE